MAKYLYLDGSCGISGDMTVAALIDLGASQEKMKRALDFLKEGGFEYIVSRKDSYSIAGCDFDVKLSHQTPHQEESYSEKHTHDHALQAHFLTEQKSAHLHPHEHAHEHHHEHMRFHKGDAASHTHEHVHRHLKEVVEIINRADMSEKAKALAQKIFFIVAEAEAKAHGVEIEKVHFHEVGAWDSIADIVAASVLMDDLDIDNCIITGLSEGTGTVMCQHGALPVPVPAVLNIAEKYQIPLKPTAVKGEMVTPTGIALAAAFGTMRELPAQYKILKSGIGLGKRDFGRANFLRALILEDAFDDKEMVAFETNIDDSTPEELGFAMEKLFETGAYDVHFEPCFMKKNRPAYILRGLISGDKIEKAVETLFIHTSTIGVRYYPVLRTCMNRSTFSVQVMEKNIDVKKSVYKDIVKIKPEYESVKSVAEKTGKSFKEIFDKAKEEALKIL